MKNIIKDFFDNEIQTDLKYSDFQSKINVTQYLKEEISVVTNKLKYKYLSIIILIMIVLLGGFFVLNIKRVKRINQDIIFYETDKEWVDAHQYIFIGKIEKELETKKYDGTGSDIPYTFYKIKIIEYLKGDGENTGILCFYGGKKFLNTWILYNTNDEIPEINKIYLFFLNKKGNDSNNQRIGNDDFIISRNDQKILLDGYDENKMIYEQNDNIKLIINRFTNVIQKKYSYKIDKPFFRNFKERINSYDYVFIAQLSIVYRSNKTFTDIPTVYYKFSILENFKKNPTQTHICYLGVNYWYDEINYGLKMPINNEIYLIFANENPSNPNELLILDNDQQIRLKYYNIHFSLQDQNDYIKSIVDDYIKLIDDINEKYK